MNLDQKGWACYLFANIHWASGQPNSGALTFGWFVVAICFFVVNVLVAMKK